MDTCAFVVDRVAEPSRVRRERDDVLRTARAALRAAGGPAAPIGSEAPGQWAWNLHRATWVREDCVVKVARSSYGEAALRRDVDARACIHARAAWQAWRPLVARTLVEHSGGGRLAVVEERLSGRPLVTSPPDERAVADVRRRIQQLGEATAHDVEGRSRTDAWLRRPAATVARVLLRRGRRGAADAVVRWASDTARAVEGTTRRVVLTHGDLWPGNVLVGPRGGVGVIDWDQASFHDPALHDRLHLTLVPVCHERRVDLGLLVRRLLIARDPDPDLLAAVRRSGVDDVLGDVGVDLRDALIWYWLRHVDRMIREPGHAPNPLWVTRNVVAPATAIHLGRRTT
jgi:hypothetical protein